MQAFSPKNDAWLAALSDYTSIVKAAALYIKCVKFFNNFFHKEIIDSLARNAVINVLADKYTIYCKLSVAPRRVVLLTFKTNFAAHLQLFVLVKRICLLAKPPKNIRIGGMFCNIKHHFEIV